MITGPRRGTAVGVLDLAVLGLLAEAPMHGYQLRTRLTEILGPARSYSYGSLYPALRRLEAAGHIAERERYPDSDPATSRRTRVTYRLTPSGKGLLADLLDDPGPTWYTDEGFAVRLALFEQTSVEVRVAILQGRCQRLERQRADLLAAISRGATRPDDDTATLHRLTIQAHDRELLWLRGLVAREQHLVACESNAPLPVTSTPSALPTRKVLP